MLTEILFDEDEENFPSTSTSPIVNTVLKMYVMFLLKWQSLFRVSDTAMNILLRFVAKFFSLLVMAFTIGALKDFADELPKNTTGAKKLIGNYKDNFLKYACCSRCDSIYPLKTCIVVSTDGTKCSRKCSHIEYPRHPHSSRRAPCGFQLMKCVRTSAGTTTLHARRMFCYKSLTESLKDLMKRPDFLDKCELWRTRNIDNDTLSYIYDGRVWKEFMNPDGVPFLSPI